MINGGIMRHQGKSTPPTQPPTIGSDAYCQSNTGGYFNGGPTVLIQWDTAATFEGGFESYRLYQDGVLVATYVGTEWSSINSIQGSNLTVTPGISYNFYVRVYDLQGRYAQTNTVAVIAASQTPPTLATTRSVHWYAGDEPSVQIYYGTHVDNSGTGLGHTSGSFYNAAYTVSLTLPAQFGTTSGQWLYNRSQIPAGTYYYYLYVVDNAGNIASETIQVICN